MCEKNTPDQPNSNADMMLACADLLDEVRAVVGKMAAGDCPAVKAQCNSSVTILDSEPVSKALRRLAARLGGNPDTEIERAENNGLGYHALMQEIVRAQVGSIRAMQEIVRDSETPEQEV